MQKTTLYLDEGIYRRLKQIARKTNRKPAALVREAIAEYTARHGARRRPKSIGKVRSGRPDLGQAAEDLLAGLGEER